MDKKKITWIELLRITACIGVIGLHAASQHFRDVPVDTSLWQVSNFYHGITRFAVACFIMISGSLYLSKNRNWTIKKVWIRNILPIAVSYMFWQFFYAVYRILIAGEIKPGSAEFFKRIMVYVSKPYFHLWYLPMLMGLLILAPLLWEIVNSSRGKQWSEYMIILFLVFQILVFTVTRFDLPWKTHVTALLNTVHPELITGFAGYFVMGHYLYEYGVPKKLERWIYVLGLSFILCGIWLCQKGSMQTGKAIQAFYDNFTIFACIWSVSVFMFFKKYVSRIKWGEKLERIICRLGGCTFGIYLIHALVRDILYRNGIDSRMISNTVLAVPAVTVLIFCISWGLVSILRKIPFVKKWIM